MSLFLHRHRSSKTLVEIRGAGKYCGVQNTAPPHDDVAIEQAIKVMKIVAQKHLDSCCTLTAEELKGLRNSATKPSA